jgi:hypothetical protein
MRIPKYMEGVLLQVQDRIHLPPWLGRTIHIVKIKRLIYYLKNQLDPQAYSIHPNFINIYKTSHYFTS